MENNLIFNETFTVEQFKKKFNIEKIPVKRNPQTNNLFFVYGTKRGDVGAVGHNRLPEHPMISWVTGDDGASFWLLHEEGKGAETIAEF